MPNRSFDELMAHIRSENDRTRLEAEAREASAPPPAPPTEDATRAVNEWQAMWDRDLARIQERQERMRAEAESGQRTVQTVSSRSRSNGGISRYAQFAHAFGGGSGGLIPNPFQADHIEPVDDAPGAVSGGYHWSDEDHPRQGNGSFGSVNQENFISGNVEVDNNMVTVAQVFGQRASYPTIESHPLIVGQNLAGVEIELENMTSNPPNFQYWEAKSDGSLRNSGMEFVCSSPWGGRDLYNAAIEIDSFLFTNSPDESWRCSTHVHVDVRNMTAPQLKRMILAYIVYERILFKCSGWHRYKNNFCVALGFAQDQLAILARAWEQDDQNFMRSIAANWDKYTSLNLLPMQSFGSIEFRISEAKWRKGRLIRLVNRFLSLKELAMNFEGDDSSFIEYLMTIPLHQAIRKGLPKVLPDFEQDMEIGYKLAHDVVSLAKCRRRNVYVHNVRNETDDTSRRMRVTVEHPYVNHLQRELRRKTDGMWLFPDNAPDVITFEWLAELQEKCREVGITFESDWFVPRQLPSQHRQLYREFYSNRNAPQPAPRRASFEEDDDEEYEGYDEEDEDTANF